MKTLQRERKTGTINESGVQTTNTLWHHRHILDLDDFSRDEIEHVLKTTDAMHEILDMAVMP